MSSMFGIKLPFYTYGILMGISFFLAIWLFKFNARNSSFATPPFVDMFLVLAVCGIVGARINYILLFPQYYKSIRDCLAIHEGGLVFYGGMIASILGLYIYCYIKEYSFSATADYMVPSLAIGHAIGRIGCLINDCCYGAFTTSIKIYHLEQDPIGCFRHPTQLYEIIYLIVLAIIFSCILKKPNKLPQNSSGCIAAYYCIAYAILRFINEFFRADSRGGFFTALNLSPAQITSLIMIICAILWLYNITKGKNQTADCGDKK